MAMKTELSASIRSTECGSLAGTNCGRNAKKKIVSLGFSRLRVMPAAITCRAGRRAWSASSASAPLSRQVAHAM
jgi:hypothetical protein